MSLIGIHITEITDLIDLSKKSTYKHLDFIQTFLSATIDYNDIKYDNVKKIIKQNDIKIAIHLSYSINLAKDWKSTDWTIQQCINEINSAIQMNAFCVVIHTGKSLSKTNDSSMISKAINNMYSSLLYIHKQINNQQIKILIETPAGQGTETLYDIKELCNFMNKFFNHPDKQIKNRFGLCIDTCHVFTAGYKEITDVIKIIDSNIGIDKIKLCHLNDSKKEFGSHLDRHENIGYGKINNINEIINFMLDLQMPIILETPEKNIENDYKLLMEMK